MAQAADRIVVEVTAVIGQYNQAMIQVANVTINNMKAAEGAAKKSSDAIGKALETAASRVPGLIKGLAEGRSALQLFLGEAAQLLPIFGPWGIALGAAAGAVGAVLENFDLLTGRVRLSSDELARMNAELDGTKEAAAAAAGGYDALIAKLATMTELQKAAFIVSREESLNNDLTELEKAIASTSGNIKDNLYDIRGQMLRTFGGVTDEAGRFAQRFQTLLDTFAAGKLPIEQYEEFRHMLEVLSVNATPELNAVLKQLYDQLAVTGAQAEEFNKKKEQTAAVTDTVNGHLSENNRLVIDNGAALDNAAGAAGRYAGSIDGVSDSFSRLRAAVAETRAESLPKTGLSFGGQSAAFGTGDLRSALAQVIAQSPGSTVPAGFEIPSRPGSGTGGRPSGAAGPPQPDTEGIPAGALEEAMRLYGETPLGKYVQAETKLIALKPALISLLQDEEAVQKVLNQALDEAAKAYDKATGESEKAKTQQKELSDAIVAVGDVFKDGIKDAKDFNDALDKIGLSLLELTLKGLFGQGALGGVFNQILGNESGAAGLFSLGSGDDQASGGGGGIGGFFTKAVSWLAGLAGLFGGGLAGGGQALPGRIYEVGEAGREWFAPSVPGQVIPNHVIKAAAGGGGGSGQPITFNISMAGANGDRAIAEIAAAAVKKGLAGVPEINRQHRIRFA